MVSAVVGDRRGSQRNESQECLKNSLIHEQRQTQAMVDACLLLLDENYLLALPLLPRVILRESPGPRNYRFLFRRHVARLLGWTERREEGEPHGFSDSVKNFIREVWWPDEVAEALHGAGHQHRQFSGASDPQVLAAASVEFPGSNGLPAPEVLLRNHGAAGVRDEVPRGHVPVLGGVDLGEGSVELGSDTSSVREARQRPQVLIDQHLVLRSSSFHEGRSVRQRLEMSAGGTVVLEQTVDGLLTSTTSREGGSHWSEVPAKKKKLVRKRQNPHSSGGRSAGGDTLGGTSG